MTEGQIFFNWLAKKYNLDTRERFILDKRFGVSGERLAYHEIGALLPEADPGWVPVSRQCVHAIAVKLKKDIDPQLWKRLEELFPEPLPESRIKKMHKQWKTAITRYLRGVGEGDTLQYGEVHRKLGIPVPEHRKQTADAMDERESCYAFLADYEASLYGRYRYCTMCREVKPISEFYKIKGVDRPYQICKKCNTERCMRFARTGDGRVHPTDEVAELASV